MLKLVILLIVLIILGGVFAYRYKKNDRYSDCLENYIYIMCLPFIVLCLLFIGMGCSISSKIVAINSTDEQIKIIEAQNENINAEVKASVLLYMDYEGDTYASIKQDLDSVDIVVLTQQFPQLKANELVNTNINVYIANENKLSKLKLDKAKNKAFVDFWW